MSPALFQLIVLAAIAIFLILKLKSVLGTRDGYEDEPMPVEAPGPRGPDRFEVIEGGPDNDIIDHVTEGSDAAVALAQMKRVEPSFNVGAFLQGSKMAYEMILMAFERGDISQVRPFLAPEVAESFDAAIAARKQQGLSVEANFFGLREMALQDATYDRDSREGEITVRFVGELTVLVRNAAGEVVEGSSKEIKRQRDSWTFARVMGAADPNWQLVATGD